MPKTKEKKSKTSNKSISKNGIIFFVLIALFVLALIFDNSLFVLIQQFRISLNLPFNFDFIESYFFYVIIFVLSMVFILLDNKVKNKKKNIFRYIIGMVMSVIIMLILKYTVSRPRPIPSQSNFLVEEKSFPSGHTTFTFSTLSFLKNWLGIIWLILSIIVALERVWIGAHFPSDVIAAIILGYFIPILTTKIINKIRLKNNQNNRARRSVKKNKTRKSKTKK